MATVELQEKNFKEVVERGGIVLIDFWAPWCAPCRAFGPIFEKSAEKHPNVVYGKVNTEQAPELAAAFGIRSIPTLMVFRDQVLLYAQPGMLPASALEELVEKVEQLDMDKVRKEIEDHKASSNNKAEVSPEAN